MKILRDQFNLFVGKRFIWLGLFFFLFSCGEKKEEKPLVQVVVFQVEPQTIPVVLEFVGVCQSSHMVEIRSRVEGYLQEISYEEGSFVEEGDILFKIDPREFEARVAEVKASLEKEKAILWSAQKAVERYKPLYEQKAASRKDWEDATAQLLAQQATVNFYEAKLDEAELDLSYTNVSSPISGITTNSRYQEGSLINPVVTGLLTTVSVVDPIWVVVNVSDYYFLVSNKEMKEGTLTLPGEYKFDVTLTLADGTYYPYPGEISFVSPVLNPSTGTLSTRGVFANPDGILKPGQFVRAQAKGAERPNAVFVPQTSVIQGEKERFVFVVKEDGRVEKRIVETGTWYRNFWIIKSGLEKGDFVIQEGVNKVKGGDFVKIIKKEKASFPTSSGKEEMYQK